jgi:TetR/AcrR family transcriptional repressor of nem operon
MTGKQERSRRSRARILEAAGTEIRRHGAAGASIDAIMAAAGLTRGGFYAHFPSKQALVAEAFEAAERDSREGWLAGLDGIEDGEWLRHVIGRYLCTAHRDRFEDGCPFAALGPDLHRQGEPLREAAQTELSAIAAALERRLPAGGAVAADERALAIFALCVGGILLARAVPDARFSEDLLRACRRFAMPSGNPAPAPDALGD